MFNVLGLDSNLIFDKIKVLPEFQDINKSEQIEVSWSEYDGNTKVQNIQQFMYWHLKKKEQDEIDNTKFAGPPPTK